MNTAIEIVPKDAVSTLAKMLVADFDSWDDSIPHFMTLHWHEGELVPGTVAIIDPSIDMDRWPQMIEGVVAGALIDPDMATLPKPCAYAVAFEAEKTRERDGAKQESYSIIAADVHGRSWHTEKTRHDGAIAEHFMPPLGVEDPATRRPSGVLYETLLAAAYATGVAYWNLPGPPAIAN